MIIRNLRKKVNKPSAIAELLAINFNIAIANSINIETNFLGIDNKIDILHITTIIKKIII